MVTSITMDSVDTLIGGPDPEIVLVIVQESVDPTVSPFNLAHKMISKAPSTMRCNPPGPPTAFRPRESHRQRPPGPHTAACARIGLQSFGL